ncbi:carbohydrate ABC transporter permease [Acuticoccus kandeliae]|uniref:carbohydrate ABC transporter permease n=1 Tax=Acuticoccus kandeliae TaxID=2073160 RepID=UPI000D3EC388|nr:carbohydrate ABC transporter permease [Acuticoccus kandeliae]
MTRSTLALRLAQVPWRRTIVGWVIGIVMFFPVYWMIISAFKPEVDLMSRVVAYIPERATLANFRGVLFETQFPRYLLNTTIAALGTCLITLVASVLAGYGLARARLRGKVVIARVLLVSYMFSPLMIGIPLYILGRQYGLLNTYPGLILAHVSLTLPFAVWLMWKFFQAIPVNYEHAAWMDGASPGRALIDVVLPMARPGMAAVAVFAFAISWGDFTMASILLTDSRMWTISTGMLTFIDQHSVHWGLIMAGAAIAAIPPLLLVYFLQRYLILGLRLG